MTDFTGLAIAGRIATPATPTGTRRAPPGTSPPTSTPSAVAFVESAEDVATTVRFAADNGLRVAGQGTGHGAVALRAARRDDPGQDRAHARRRGRRRARRPPGSRPASSSLELGEAAQRARPLLDAGLLARRRRHRLHARRRPQLARPPPRLRLQPGRARSSWSPPTASRAPSTPRTTPTSSGRCAAAAAATRSSPRCRSSCCRSPRSTGAPWSSRPRSAPTRSAPTATGPHGVPDEVTSVVRFVTPPPIPDVPEPIRGRPLLTIDGACIGSKEEGEAAIAPLRAIGETIMDTFAWMPAAGLSRIHMDPEQPGPGRRRRQRWSPSCPTRRSTPGSAWPGPTPAPRCC